MRSAECAMWISELRQLHIEHRRDAPDAVTVRRDEQLERLTGLRLDGHRFQKLWNQFVDRTGQFAVVLKPVLRDGQRGIGSA